LGIPETERQSLFGYFSNPFLRVNHDGGLDAYVQSSARGRYGELALVERCYVAPTQATFTPDGTQYRCGSHAIRHLMPLGNIREGGVYEHIRRGISELHSLPDAEMCHGCALATLYINQDVEGALKAEVYRLLVEAGRQPVHREWAAAEQHLGEQPMDL